MNIYIRKIENTENEYMAYFKSMLYNKATFLVYFQDHIFGSAVLKQFTEMIKSQFKNEKIYFILSDKSIHFKNQSILCLLQPLKK